MEIEPEIAIPSTPSIKLYKFINHTNEIIVINKENQTVYLSLILKSTWYGDYFIKKYGTDKKFKDHDPAVRAILNFTAKYISAQQTSFLETGNYSVKNVKYDWNINEQ